MTSRKSLNIVRNVIMLAGLALLFPLLLYFMGTQRATREHLDRLLGKTLPLEQATPRQSLPKAAPGQLDSMAPFFPWEDILPPGLENNDTVKIAETEQTYIIYIPLQSPDDAEHIQIEVKPRQIHLSGQITLQGPDGTAMGSSRFIRWFMPAHPVDPARIEKILKDNLLAITLYKQSASKPAPQVPPPNPNWEDLTQQKPKSFI